MKQFIDTQFTTVTEDGEQTRVPDLGGAESNNDVQYSVYDREQDGGTGALARVTAMPQQMQQIEQSSVTTVVTDDDVVADDSVPFGGQNVGLESLDQPDIEVDEELDALAPDDVLDIEEMDRAYIIHNWTRGPLERDDRQNILEQYGASNLRNLLYETGPRERSAIVQEYALDSFPNDNLDTSTIARSVVQNQTKGRQVLQDQELTALNKAATALGREKASTLPKHSRADNSDEMGQSTKDLLDGRNGSHKQMLDYVKGRNGRGPPWDGDSDESPPGKGQPQL